MNIQNTMEILCYFLTYSFLGWVCECIYCSLAQGKWVNRGFCYGPYCPIYGFGAIFVILLLNPFKESVSCVFIFGMILTSLLEYVTSWLMEKLFHMKWWDYSHYRFNIHGRVCLLNSTLFGLMSIFVVEELHPHVQHFYARFPSQPLAVFLIIAFTLFILDVILTAHGLLKHSSAIKRIEKDFEEFKAALHSDLLNKEQLQQRIEKLANENEIQIRKRLGELRAQLDKLNQKSTNHIQQHLKNAFPTRTNQRLHSIDQFLKTTIDDLKKKGEQNED